SFECQVPGARRAVDGCGRAPPRERDSAVTNSLERDRVRVLPPLPRLCGGEGVRGPGARRARGADVTPLNSIAYLTPAIPRLRPRTSGPLSALPRRTSLRRAWDRRARSA